MVDMYSCQLIYDIYYNYDNSQVKDFKTDILFIYIKSMPDTVLWLPINYPIVAL